jgi:hypothetical protein
MVFTHWGRSIIMLDDIDRSQSNYTQEITTHIPAQTKEILEWIKKQF